MKSLIQKKLHLRKSRTIQNYTPGRPRNLDQLPWAVQVPRAESVIKRGWEIPEVAMEGDHQWKTIGEPQESGDLTILNHT